MDTQSIPTSLAPEVIIDQVLGDLSIKGWDEPSVTIEADPTELKLEQIEDTLYLNCTGDCRIHLPHGATIQIKAVHGDAHFKYLQDTLSLDVVHGSITLRTVAETRINSIHGDFSAKQIDGSLFAEIISGNAAIRDVANDCILQNVHGNLDLRNIDGQVSVSCSGNLRLRLGFLGAETYQAKAEGNLHCDLPLNASANLILSSGAEIIKVKTPEKSQVYRQPKVTLDLEDSQSEIQLSAGGGLYVKCDEENGEGFLRESTFDPGDFGDQIAQQVEAQISSHMELMSQQMNEQLERMSDQFKHGGMSSEQVNRILGQARQASERGAARAQEKLRQSQEKLERKLEANRRLQEKRARAASGHSQAQDRRTWGSEPPSAPTAPMSTPGGQATEEERLMILRMLEQKKITLEEADRLLSALEGTE